MKANERQISPPGGDLLLYLNAHLYSPQALETPDRCSSLSMNLSKQHPLFHLSVHVTRGEDDIKRLVAILLYYGTAAEFVQKAHDREEG